MENLESNISCLSEACFVSKILSYSAEQLSIPNLKNIYPGGKALRYNESFVSSMGIKCITKQRINCIFIFFLGKKRKVTKE